MDHIAFITPIYTAFFGFMLVILSWRVTKMRRAHEGNKMREAGHTELAAAVRAKENLVEYLPLALLLMWMLEIMQFAPNTVHALGILLVVARMIHLHGLKEPSGESTARRLGTKLTWLHILIAGALCFCGAFGITF